MGEKYNFHTYRKYTVQTDHTAIVADIGDPNISVGMTTSKSVILKQIYDGTERYVPDVVFLAKLQAAWNFDKKTTCMQEHCEDRHIKILWRSGLPENQCKADCSDLLKRAEVSEVYDNCVDMTITVFADDTHPGRKEKITVYCFYDNKECLKPKAGYVVMEHENKEFAIPLAACETAALQEVLDRTEFKQYQFGKDVAELEEEEEMVKE